VIDCGLSELESEQL